MGDLHLHLIDELSIGGAQTHLVTMLREGSRYRFDHRVICLFGDGPVGGQLRDIGMAVEALELRPLFVRHRFLAASRVVEERIRALRPTLVEAHLTWSRLLGLYAAWRARIPLRIGFEQGDIYLNSWKFRLANFVAQHFAQRIVVCSAALAEWAHRTHGISRSKLLVMHNCVDAQRFRPHRAPGLRASWGFPSGSTVFAAVGTLGTGVNKRVDVIIRAVAAAKHKGVPLALVVCGDGSQRTALEQLAAALGVQPLVRFLGTRQDIPDVLAACDAFCHAAPFEPFGIVCIEAMAMGLPVVVPDSGGIREAVEDGVTGYVYPALDHWALANAMCRLAADETARIEIGRAARAAVEQRFSAQAYVQRLYSAYGFATGTVVATPA